MIESRKREKFVDVKPPSAHWGMHEFVHIRVDVGRGLSVWVLLLLGCGDTPLKMVSKKSGDETRKHTRPLHYLDGIEGHRSNVSFEVD